MDTFSCVAVSWTLPSLGSSLLQFDLPPRMRLYPRCSLATPRSVLGCLEYASLLLPLRSPHTSTWPNSTGHRSNRGHSLIHISCLSKLRVGDAIPTQQLPVGSTTKAINQALSYLYISQEPSTFCLSCLQCGSGKSLLLLPTIGKCVLNYASLARLEA